MTSLYDGLVMCRSIRRALLLGAVFFALLFLTAYGQNVTIKPGDILYHPAAYARDNPLIFLPFIALDDRSGAFGHIGLVELIDQSYWVIEARSNGVIRYSIADFVNRYATGPNPFVYILRVNASPAVINNAIYFASAQVGMPYDTDWSEKELFGPSYYCSELVWAAYEYASGAYVDSSGRIVYGYINLDAGDAPGYVTGLPVSPNEIFRSEWTRSIAKVYSR